MTRILLVEGDADAVARTRSSLDGYDVETAPDGDSALASAFEDPPDLILLDVMQPEVDGLEISRRLRTDPRTASVPVIMVAASSLLPDKLVGLTARADDYLIEPYDPVELAVRVATTLRRVRHMRDLNPLTGFPGNVAIHEEVERRLETGEPFALMHVDLDNFKAFNDHYGFIRGDLVIKLLSSTLAQTLTSRDGQRCFVGHIGGDDFVVLCDVPSAEDIAREIIGRFDSSIGRLYDVDDLERGYVEVPDRKGVVTRFPVTTVSIGIATNSHRKIRSVAEAGEIAGEMKHVAKQSPESSFAVDRRRS